MPGRKNNGYRMLGHYSDHIRHGWHVKEVRAVGDRYAQPCLVASLINVQWFWRVHRWQPCNTKCANYTDRIEGKPLVEYLFWNWRGRGRFVNCSADEQEIPTVKFRHHATDAPTNAFGFIGTFESPNNPFEVQIIKGDKFQITLGNKYCPITIWAKIAALASE